MKKVRMYIIPIMILLLFVGIMNSGGILKQPFSKTDDVLSYIEALKKDVVDENWKQAEIDIARVKSAWRIVEKRVQFSVERNDINEIDINIARIEGALLAKDKTSAFIELSQITRHWNELEK